MLIIRFFNMVLIQGCASWVYSVHTILLVWCKGQDFLAAEKGKHMFPWVTVCCWVITLNINFITGFIYLLSFIYSICLMTFTVHFTILLTNVFRSLFEIPEVCHELGNFITQLSIKSQNLNQSCKFHGELCWEVTKFCERGADTLGW